MSLDTDYLNKVSSICDDMEKEINAAIAMIQSSRIIDKRKECYALYLEGCDYFKFLAVVYEYPSKMMQFISEANADYSDPYVDIAYVAKPVNEYGSIAEYEEAEKEEMRYQLGDEGYEEYLNSLRGE